MEADETHQNKPSGIPRPSKIPVQTSRLPVPVQRANSIRQWKSRESLMVEEEPAPQSPRLRTTVSQDRLAPSPTARSSTTNRTPSASFPTRTPNRASAGSSSNVRTSSATTPQPMRLVKGPIAHMSCHGTRPGPNTASAVRHRSSQQSLTSQFSPRQDHFPADVMGSLNDVHEEPDHASKTRSLTERTIETLSRLPSSPANKGRHAPSFYETAITGRKTSRPSSRASTLGSSHRSDDLSDLSLPGSRPTSRDGTDDGTSTVRSHASSFKSSLPTFEGAPLRTRRSVQSMYVPKTSSTARSVRSSVYGALPARTRSPSPAATEIHVPKSSSRAATARLTKKPSVQGLAKKSSSSTLKGDAPRKASIASRGSSAPSVEGTSTSISSSSTSLTVDSAEQSGPAYRKTSAALREQIAKAKAAKRAAQQKEGQNGAGGFPADFNFDLVTDPFNQRRDDKSQAAVLKSRLESARTSGRLNIAAMGLKEIPRDVLQMYNIEYIGQSGSAWAESVDLTRFVAADNEIEMISDEMFPDVDPQELAEQEDSQGNIFAGLETLDLHGNILVSLPMGLRRLSFLTSLNLSLNRLGNNCLEVICQIPSLKDLKLGGNLLYGPLDPCFSKLENLENLDLHGNQLSALPSNFGNLSRLRILNLSENSFEELPFDILSHLPLTELVARKNQLHGTLIQDSVDALQSLQTIDVSSNQLTHICSPGKTVAMPALHQFCVSMNRLQALPDISSWTNLITLAADENSINAIPEGFTKLEKLRTVDFSSNDIRIVPAEIGRMENLANLRLSGNPLREKKFSSISTEEMKEILAQRLEPDETEHIPEPSSAIEAPDGYFTCPEPQETEPKRKAVPKPVPEPAPQRVPQVKAPAPVHAQQDNHDDDSRSEMDHFTTPPTSAPGSPMSTRSHQQQHRRQPSIEPWPVKPGGVLDRSNTQSASLHPVICSKLAASHRIVEVHLHHNLFTSLPESLTFFAETLTALSLSHNQLVGESYLTTDTPLDLPALSELNLAHNHITSLQPLLTNLHAPTLSKLDVSFNRISALPPGTSLRDAFPNLTVLLISNNHLVDLEPDAIKGLRVVDAANNDIAHLNPRIGLLGRPAGNLERLEVSGNRFRVPRWSVLERGTEATLRWLRGRVPVAEMGAWRGEDGEEDE